MLVTVLEGLYGKKKKEVIDLLWFIWTKTRVQIMSYNVLQKLMGRAAIIKLLANTPS